MRIISIEEWKQIGHYDADYKIVATVNVNYHTVVSAFDLPVDFHVDPELGKVFECAFETDSGRPYYIQQALEAKDGTANYIKIFCQYETADGQPFDNVRIQSDMIEALQDLNIMRCQLVSVDKRFDLRKVAEFLKADTQPSRPSAMILTL